MASINPLTGEFVLDDYVSDVPNINQNIMGGLDSWNNTGGMTYTSSGNPLSGDLNVGITPNFELNVPVRASVGDALSYTGDQIQQGNVMGGLSDLLGYTKDKFNDTQLGQDWGNLSVGQQAGTIWGGLQSLGNLYKSYKGFQLAKDQMNFQKDMWNKSWNANKKQFNEAVNSRAESRYNTVDNRDQREDYKKQYSI